MLEYSNNHNKDNLYVCVVTIIITTNKVKHLE